MMRKSKPGSMPKRNMRRISKARPRISLSSLVVKRNWDAVLFLLTSTPGEVEIDEKSIIDRDNILHFALRYHAPLDVVQLIHNRYPRCVNKPDRTGKLCAHVACKYSAVPDVVAYIISKNASAAGCPDNHGKCPIHYVAEFYSRQTIHHEDEYMTNEELMLEVVQLLRQAAPQSFNLEDEDERNPIEIALENDVAMRVVKLMQRTARDDWRRRRQTETGNGMTHDVLAKNLERTANEARSLLLAKVSRNERTPKAEQTSISSSSLKRSFTAKSA